MSDAVLAVTSFGNLAVLGPVAAVAVTYLLWRCGLRAALKLGLPVLAAFLLTLALKMLAEAIGWAVQFPAPLLSYRVPSGHAAMSAAIYGGVGWLVARSISGWAGVAVRVGTASLVLMIAASRLVLQVHGLGDVVAGLAIGCLAGDAAGDAARGCEAVLRPVWLVVLVICVAGLMLASGLRFDSAGWI